MDRHPTSGDSGETVQPVDVRKLGGNEFGWTKIDEFAPLISVIIVKVRNGPSAQTLVKALLLVQQDQPLLGVSLKKSARDFWFQRHTDPPPVPVTIDARTGPDHCFRIAEKELTRRFDTSLAPLMRVTYLQGDDESELIFSAHHSIIDGRSGSRMIDDLLTRCAAIEAGQDVVRPAPKNGTAFPRPMEEMFPKTHLGLNRLVRISGFILRQAKTEMIYRARLGKRQKTHGDIEARCRVRSIKFTVDQTTGLVRNSRRRRLPLNSVLHAAMLISVSRQLYQGSTTPMRGVGFADLRPYLQPPQDDRVMSLCMSMVQYTVNVNPNSQVWELAAEIRDQILAGTKGGDKFTSAQIVRHLIEFMVGRRSLRLGMVALSYAGPLDISQKYGSIYFDGLHAFTSNNTIGVELAGFGNIVGGRLTLDLQHIDCDMDDEMSESAENEVENILIQAATETGPQDATTH